MYRSIKALCVLASAAVALPSLGHAQSISLSNSCDPYVDGVWFDGTCLTAGDAPSLFGLDAAGVTEGTFAFCRSGSLLVHGCAEVSANFGGAIGTQGRRLTDTRCEPCRFNYEPVVDFATVHEILPPAEGADEVFEPSVSLKIVRVKAPYFYKDYNKPKPIKVVKLKLPDFKPGLGPPKPDKPKPDDKPEPDDLPSDTEDETAELSFLSLLTYDPSVFPGRPDDLMHEGTWTEPFDPYLGVTDPQAACAVAAARVRGLFEVALQELTLECHTFAPFSSSGLVQLPEYLVSFEHGGQLHDIDACTATDGFLQHELVKAEVAQFDLCIQDPSLYIE